MAAAKVTGLSPVTFISEDPKTAGTHYQIPLSCLKIDENGAIDPSGWPTFKSKTFSAADAKLLQQLLDDLLKRGTLSAAPP
jgi:hypothetical protein